MATGNINLLVRCEECTYADWVGRSCQHGLLFPIGVLMSGEKCPNFKPKTTEQLLEQQSKRRNYGKQ